MLSLYLAALESDGDKKQFRELYRRYHRVMERTALAVLHDPHDAEEAVQEAFLRVIENFSRIDKIPCKDLGGWLVIIVRNEAITILRRRRCHLPLEEGWADFAGQSRDLPAYSSMVQLFARAAGHLPGRPGDEAGAGLVHGGDRPAAGPDGERREHPAVPGAGAAAENF